ncbi:MAG TPA: hypothetical protein VJN92_15610 [Candidatus Acidoferrum sp.]|nr:hypothetical protein [Candidatus Acidoferrum sp.]
MAMNDDAFNSPEFLKFACKHGLLSPNADKLDAYKVHGQILHNEMIRSKRLVGRCLQVIAGLEIMLPAPLQSVLDSLTAAELQTLRESITGVLPFSKATS